MNIYRVRVKQTCYFDIEATSKENAKAKLFNSDSPRITMREDAKYKWDYDEKVEVEELNQ